MNVRVWWKRFLGESLDEWAAKRIARGLSFEEAYAEAVSMLQKYRNTLTRSQYRLLVKNIRKTLKRAYTAQSKVVKYVALTNATRGNGAQRNSHGIQGLSPDTYNDTLLTLLSWLLRNEQVRPLISAVRDKGFVFATMRLGDDSDARKQDGVGIYVVDRKTLGELGDNVAEDILQRTVSIAQIDDKFTGVLLLIAPITKDPDDPRIVSINAELAFFTRGVLVNKHDVISFIKINLTYMHLVPLVEDGKYNGVKVYEQH